MWLRFSCENVKTPFKLANFSEKPSCKIASTVSGLVPWRKKRSPTSSLNCSGKFLDAVDAAGDRKKRAKDLQMKNTSMIMKDNKYY